MTAGVPDEDSLPLSAELRIDDLCSRFEEAWKAAASGGARPRIEDYLLAVEEAERWPLLRELLLLELHYRGEERPSHEEYGRRFPAYAERIVLIFRGPAPVDQGQAPGSNDDRDANSAGPERPCQQPGRGVLPAVSGYEVLGELGRGGMGLVYKARQPGTNRLVALKTVLAGRYAEPQERERFRVEIEAAARVKHPNVVTVYECGEHEGLPYFSMELVEGGTLVELLGGKPLPACRAAALVRSLAQGLQQMHAAGIVHRDLKPRNVLLTEEGTPKISDFGLAKLIDRSGGTQPDVILGTPAYMSPEVAAGGSKRAAPAADVYGLGAILYEALTGRPPFRGDTKAAILELVRTRMPARPRALRPEIDPALEQIVLRCLHKEPGLRYRTAAELADALGCWLAGRRSRVRPWYWLSWAWYVTRRRAAWIGMALLVVGGAAVLLALWALDPDRPRREIRARLARGDRVELIGATGGPRWSRWRLGAEEAQVQITSEGSFTLYTWADASLLELVDDPQTTHYLFRAEVRHENSDKLADGVGLFVGYRPESGDGPRVHCGCRLSYDDIFDALEDWRTLPAETRPPQSPKGNQVYLGGFLQVEQVTGPGHYRCAYAHVTPEMFVSAGPGRTDWRKLTLEVSPERLAGWWSDQPVGEVPANDFQEHGAYSAEFLRGTSRIGPARQLDTALHPRGGIGLFLSHGSASFRNVVIEPLDNGP
jgi:serine/threonine-protein kinase